MLRVGDIVRTTHGTGPYVIKDIHGPCRCVAYHDHINGNEKPSELHYHIGAQCPPFKAVMYCLNGYRLDGTNVWSDDRLTVESAEALPAAVKPPPRQLDLFGVPA